MSRIVFWLLLACLVIFAIRSKIRDAQKRHEQRFRQPPSPSSPAGPSPSAGGYRAARAEKAVAEAETMLECARCGVYYPASETVRHDGRDFCSAAHAHTPTPS